MRAVQWSDLAIADLEAIDDYLTAYSDDAAERASLRIEYAANFLSTMPAAGPALRRGAARKWRVASTPYLLVYRVLDGGIEVLRVHHGSQDWSID